MVIVAPSITVIDTTPNLSRADLHSMHKQQSTS